MTHASPPPGPDVHPSRALGRQPGLEPAERLAQLGLEVGDELGRVQRPADGPVVDVAVVLEADGQVVLGVVPPAAAGHPDLAPPDGVAQRLQQAQLVGDPFHPARLVDDRLLPLRGDDPADRHAVGRREVAILPGMVGVAAQQLEGVHHRPVRGVVAAEVEGSEQPGQHPAVVGGVRGAQHRPDPLTEGGAARPRLAHEVSKCALADDRVEGAAHGLIGMSEGSLSEREEDALLAAHPPEVRDQLTLDFALRLGVDLVDQADQEVDQAVGDLRRPRPAECGQQGQSNWLWAIPKIGRVHAGNPRAPGSDQLLRGVGEQLRGQAELLDLLELLDLPEERLQPQLTGVALQLGEEPACAPRRPTAIRLGDELRQLRGGLGREPPQDAVAELLLRSGARRTEDALDPARSRRLDLGRTAAVEHRLPLPLHIELDWADRGGQPLRQVRLVTGRRLAKAEGLANLGSMPLDRSGGPVVVGEELRLYPHLLGDVGDRRLRHLPGVAGNLASSSKNLSSTAKPSRVAPALLAISSQSVSTSLQQAIRSSGSQSRRMAHHPVDDLSSPAAEECRESAVSALLRVARTIAGLHGHLPGLPHMAEVRLPNRNPAHAGRQPRGVVGPV